MFTLSKWGVFYIKKSSNETDMMLDPRLTSAISIIFSNLDFDPKERDIYPSLLTYAAHGEVRVVESYKDEVSPKTYALFSHLASVAEEILNEIRSI